MCKNLKKTKNKFIYNNFIFDYCVNKIMRDGKKERARRIFCKFFKDLSNYSGNKNTFEFFLKALFNISPRIIKIFDYDLNEKQKFYMIEELPSVESLKLGLTFFIRSSLSQTNRFVHKKLFNEIIDAYNKKGKAFQKKCDYEKKILKDTEGLEILSPKQFLYLDKQKFAKNKL